MRNRSTKPGRSKRYTLAEMPFCELIQKDKELSKLRRRYARASAKRRRTAAEWEYDSAYASFLFGQAVGRADLIDREWHGEVAALAIDPDFAPAILAVGSLEYQYGRVEKGMELLLSLASLPADTEDLPEIIDEAGDFLIDREDYRNAERLYAAAAGAYPQVAIYHIGLGYCAAKTGRKEEAVTHTRRAVELEPDNYRHLSDLGFGLTEAGQYEEAEEVLQRAVRLAPPDYEMAKGNLDHLRALRDKAR